MKPFSRHLLVASLGLTLCCVSGCASVNVQQTRIGTVTALAHVENKVPSYFQIEIEKPMDDLAPRIWIRLPDGKILDRAWYDYASLKRAGFHSFAERDYQPSARFSQELTRYGVSFFFDLGSLKLIRFTQATGESATIGREKTKVFYSLPLTQEQLEQIFGKPDSISNKIEL